MALTAISAEGGKHTGNKGVRHCAVFPENLYHSYREIGNILKEQSEISERLKKLENRDGDMWRTQGHPDDYQNHVHSADFFLIPGGPLASAPIFMFHALPAEHEAFSDLMKAENKRLEEENNRQNKRLELLENNMQQIITQQLTALTATIERLNVLQKLLYNGLNLRQLRLAVRKDNHVVHVPDIVMEP